MPCSIDRTPARRAALMPSLAWAWAITQRPAAVVGRGQDAARGRDLDHVGAGPDQLADLAAHGLRPVDLAVGHARVDRPEVELLPRRVPAVAVPAGLGEQGQ